MNILFLTISNIESLDDRGIYPDLLAKFRNEGHQVFIVSPAERRRKKPTRVIHEGNVHILRVRTFNIQKTNVIEKGIATLAIENQYMKAIMKYFPEIKFDLVLYSTPPITFIKVIRYFKQRDHAYAYLLLKDIFPQNAVDLKMIKENGMLHRLFRKKEKKLYKLSDSIGCMSEANRAYVLQYNQEVNPEKVEINPNSITPIAIKQSKEEKKMIRKKYGLPEDKFILAYGGNLGKPQGIDFLLETIERSVNSKIFFLVVGSGTEYPKIKKWFAENSPANAGLLAGLPKNDYDHLLNACDVGLIFLHRDFTIPNFPARFLSYLEMKMPVIAATDKNTDIGTEIEKGNCGFWVQAGDGERMQAVINEIFADKDKLESMQKNSWKLLQKKYTVDRSYRLIINKIGHVQ